MACGAVLIARAAHVVRSGLQGDTVGFAAKCARAVVAFEAGGEDAGAAQKLGVGGAMRIVAGFAAVDAHGGMLKGERAALVGVALEAGLLIGKSVGHHAGADSHAPGGGGGSVRIVAIRTVHEAFIDAVFEGHGELRADVGMAAVAEICLLLGEQKFRSSRFVHRVATIAGDFPL